MSDDNYYMDTEQEQKQNSAQSKACNCLKKFFLLIITCGLIALLVFQIILMSATTEVQACEADVADAVADAIADAGGD